MLLSTDLLTHPTWNAVSNSSGESTYRMVRVRIGFRVRVLGIELGLGFRDRIRVRVRILGL